MLDVRYGWGVAIRRTDGTEFLASSSPGILPAVWPMSQRRNALAHKRDLIDHGFNARVKRVAFSDPVIVPADDQVRRG